MCCTPAPVGTSEPQPYDDLLGGRYDGVECVFCFTDEDSALRYLNAREGKCQLMELENPQRMISALQYILKRDVKNIGFDPRPNKPPLRIIPIKIILETMLKEFGDSE